ncbi:MAG TPA: isoprenylcysteine carboxylmethyltransferase family protein [Micropepsaceae bacterium]|jgi:protein-S-isoprenylcysteine O-methyltransferase Ste14
MSPALGFILAWTAWALSWGAAAAWSSHTAKRSAIASALAYRLTITAGAVLLFHRTSERLKAPMLWHVGLIGAWLLVAVAVLGFLFTWWARLHLGKLWSGSVTLKEDHRIIDSGPYGLVRHPIYTGILVAIFATAAAEATLPAMTGAALMSLGIWMKARVEEKFLRQELGAAAYDSYAARVPMLLPFL